MNKYVEFVSDEDFEKEVKRVIDTYIKGENKLKATKPQDLLTNEKNKNKQNIDQFKYLFDIYIKQLTLKEWAENEIVRQVDKTNTNAIGYFHQYLLGHVEGWIDLGIGDVTEIDLKNEEETIFIEVKNKYNTMNSSSSKTCREKLINARKNYPKCTAYWAYIVSKNYNSINKAWEKKNYETDEKIREISGDILYEIVTGDPNALQKTYNAIPKAINNILRRDYTLSINEEKIMSIYENYVFNK